MTNRLPPERLREICSYDPETGEIGFIGSKRKTTQRVGNTYQVVMIGRVVYSQHRLAWALHFGSWPVGEIDHINRDKSDNRLENLRDVNTQTNSQNRHGHMSNKTGFPGVQFDRRRSHYLTRLRVDGRSFVHRGFETAEDAHAAYVRLKVKHHLGYVHLASGVSCA